MTNTKPQSSTLYVDVTSTWESGVQTGIQRVVRQLVAGWLETEVDFELVVYSRGEFQVMSGQCAPRLLSPKPKFNAKVQGKSIFFNLLKHFYLRSKPYFPDTILRKLKSTMLFIFIRDSLSSKSLPSGSTRSLPNGSTVLLLDIISNPNHISKLKEMVERGMIEIVFFSYDCNPYFWPDYYPKELRDSFLDYLSLVPYSGKIWSISKTAQNDVAKFSNPGTVFENRWLAPTVLPECVHDRQNPYLPLEDEYLLMVASFVPSKNHHGFLEALKSILSKGVKVPKVYLVGGASWMDEEITREILVANAFGLRVERFINVDDCCIRRLYENALFTVLPSFVEGFGLPIVESLSFGKPVITSTSTSMGELLDLPGTIGFRHDSAPFLEEILERMLNDHEFRNQLTLNARQNMGKLGNWRDYSLALYDFCITGKEEC